MLAQVSIVDSKRKTSMQKVALQMTKINFKQNSVHIFRITLLQLRVLFTTNKNITARHYKRHTELVPMAMSLSLGMPDAREGRLVVLPAPRGIWWIIARYRKLD